MKTRLLNLLTCPACKHTLTLQPLLKEGDEIVSGLLSCAGCGQWFPILRGIPRMLLGELRNNLVLTLHSEFLTTYRSQLPSEIVTSWDEALRSSAYKEDLKIKTAQSFGYEWTTFHTMCDAYRQNFLDYIHPLNESFLKGKVVLDAGCGVGRHTYWAAQFGAKEVIGMDLSNAVEASAENTKVFSNVHIVQGDIYNPPFREVFDYVMSIGVLHHLPDPEKGFASLLPTLKKDGTISIWVYGRRYNISNVYIYETLRLITRKIPHRLLHTLCYLPAIGVAGCNVLYKLLQRSRITKPLASLVPFKVYASFPFIVKVNDAFDVFATPKSTYWKIEEIQDWYKRAGLKDYSVTYLRKKSLKAYGILPS